MSIKSIEQVAREALNKILGRSISERSEYGGMIYMKTGVYIATEPRTQGYGNTVNIGMSEPNRGCPVNTTPVATFHTHPNYLAAGLEMTYNEFSDEDKFMSKDSGLDAYLGTLDGSFFRYDQKQAKALRLSGKLRNSSK